MSLFVARGLAAGLLVLAGCAGGHGSQVVAVVNGEEITALQLAVSMKGEEPTSAAEAKAMRQAALQSLIDERLLAQKARELKLDKQPAIARDMEEAGRAVLARAYLDRTTAPQAPSEFAIAKYYEAHPYVFAERQRYLLTRIAAQGSPADLKPIVKAFGMSGASLDTVKTLLEARGIEVAAVAVTIDADQLPDPVARQLVSMHPGDLATFRAGATQVFMRLDSASAAPVQPGAAKPKIAQQLANESQSALADAELERLRKAATIDIRPVARVAG